MGKIDLERGSWQPTGKAGHFAADLKGAAMIDRGKHDPGDNIGT